MEEMALELDFEIENFEEEDEGESFNSSSESESDTDAGELGEFDDESNSVGDTLPQAAGGAGAVVRALAYRHEPEQILDENVDLDGQNFGDARPRGNLDHTRLDPNSTENWYVDKRLIIIFPDNDICSHS